jgi:hypothetical protein
MCGIVRILRREVAPFPQANASGHSGERMRAAARERGERPFW